MKRFLILFALAGFFSPGVTAQAIKGRYAVQNLQTVKNLRPFEAGKGDGNKIVLYDHHWWKCMTWEFSQLQGDTYQLKNRYTEKSFQASSKLESGVNLWQQPVKSDSSQDWEFIKQAENTYRIKHKGTDLCVTISSDETNSTIILAPKQNSNGQLWKLVEQDPWF